MTPHSSANGSPVIQAKTPTSRPVMTLIWVRTSMYLRNLAAVAALPSSRTRAASGLPSVSILPSDVVDFQKSEDDIDKAITQKLSVVLTRPVTCCVVRSIHATLKCSAHTPATEMPWPSSHVTMAS